jgi:hypothetical protein
MYDYIIFGYVKTIYREYVHAVMKILNPANEAQTE